MPDWHGWLLLGASLIAAIVLNVTVLLPLDRTVVKTIVLFLVPLAALLFVAHGNIGAVIKKPRPADIPLVIVVVVLGFIYSIAVGALLKFGLGMAGSRNAVLDQPMGLGFVVLVFVQLFGEELLKTKRSLTKIDITVPTPG